MDIDFKQLERRIVEEFQGENKRFGKTVYPMDAVKIAARAATIAIQKYHEQVLQSQQETP